MFSIRVNSEKRKEKGEIGRKSKEMERYIKEIPV
jgi:hypothetical protein